MVQPVSMMGDIPHALDLSRFDVIVIHYSLVISNDVYLSPESRGRLRRSSALKALFIQDEYRFVNRSIDAMRSIGLDILFTCVPESEISKVYSEGALPDVRKVNVLTGYVDQSLLDMQVPDYRNRSIDIGYRARKVPAWLGQLGQEKWEIGRFVEEAASAYGLATDIAYREESRLYGIEWTRFLANCRATLGVESGASVFDFTGKIQADVEAEVARSSAVPFDELQKKYFIEEEGKIYLNQISPRCFEAAALKTLMILYEGDYSGRLTPWRHYLPLKKDHGNFSQIVDFLKNEYRVREVTEAAYYEVAKDHRNSFVSMVEVFDNALETELGERYAPVLFSYNMQDLSALQMESKRINASRHRKRKVFSWCYFFLFGTVLGFTSEEFRDNVQKRLSLVLKPIYRSLFRR